jgi:hypothetical protein
VVKQPADPNPRVESLVPPGLGRTLEPATGIGAQRQSLFHYGGQELGTPERHRHALAAERINGPLAVSGIEDAGELRSRDLDANAGNGLPRARRDTVLQDAGQGRIDAQRLADNPVDVPAVATNDGRGQEGAEVRQAGVDAAGAAVGARHKVQAHGIGCVGPVAGVQTEMPLETEVTRAETVADPCPACLAHQRRAAAVGRDRDAGANLESALGRLPHHEAGDAPLGHEWAGDPGSLEDLGAGRARTTDEQIIEDGPAQPDARTPLGPDDLRLDAATPWRGDPDPADRLVPRAGHRVSQAQAIEDAPAFGAEVFPAKLVARERGRVEQRHPHAPPGQRQRQRRTSRSRAGDRDVIQTRGKVVGRHRGTLTGLRRSGEQRGLKGQARAEG